MVATSEVREELDWPEKQQAPILPETTRLEKSPDRWVLVVEAKDQQIELENGEVKLTVDCAAEVHVCPLWFGEGYGLQLPQRGLRVRAASGKIMKYHGRRTVLLYIDEHMVQITFHVLDVVRPLLSVAEPYDHGYAVHLKKDHESITDMH